MLTSHIAVLGVRMDGSQAIGEAAKLDKAIDRVGDSAEAARDKVSGLGEGANRTGGELGGAADRSTAAGTSFNKLAFAVGAVFVAADIAGHAISAFARLVGDAIDESEGATAAVDRMTDAAAHLKGEMGDALAPALEEVAEIVEELATDPLVVDMFRDLGVAVGETVSFVAELVKGLRELMTFAGTIDAVVFRGVDPAAAQQALRIMELQRQAAAQEYRQRRGAGDHEEIRKRIEADLATLKRANEERRREAEKTRREREREEQQLSNLIDGYDKEGAAKRRLIEDERELARALADGKAPVEELTAAMKQLRKEREELERKGRMEQEFVPDIGESTVRLRETLDLSKLVVQTVDKTTIRGREAGEEFENWANVIGYAADALGAFNNDLGRTLAGVAGVVGMFGQMKNMQANGASKGEMAIAGAEMGGQVFGIGQSAGLWKGDRGRGKFGGKLSGDYADMGAMVGGAIGSIWGPVGALIGSVLGGAIGGAIKKGADEGLASIRGAAGQAAILITKDEGGLGKAIGGIGEEVLNLTKNLSAALGGSLRGIAPIDLKVRDDVVTVVVNGMKRRFKDVDEAIAFAVREALSISDISGMDAMFREALAGSTANSLEELQSDLTSVQSVLSFGLGEVAMAARQATAELDVLANEMARLLGGSEELGRALSYIATEEARRWDDLRDRITGDQDSPAEIAKEREQDRLMFNAERALRLAELQARHESIAAQIEIFKVENTLASQRAKLGEAELRVRSRVLGGELQMMGEYAGAAGSILGLSIETLQAQLAAIDQVIAAMPPEIGKGDLKPLGRGGGFGGAVGDFGGHVGTFGGAVNSWKAAQQGLLESLQRIALGESTTALTGAEQSVLAKRELDSLIGRAERGDIQAVEKLGDAFGTFAEIYKSYTGGGQGFLGDFRDVWQSYFDRLETIGTMERPGRVRNQNVVFDERFHQGQRDQLREQREHRRQAREDIRALTMAVERGNQQASQLAEQIRREGKVYAVGR